MAGFLSTMFGGGAERDAANRNRATYGQYQTNAFGALDSGLDRSVGAVTTGANSANDRLGANTGLYGDMYNTGSGILDRNLTSGVNALSSGRDSLSALGTEYGRGREMYQNSLGLNGAAGNANAVSAFQTGPGYEFTRDQGLQAINRRRAAGGMLNSGNADIDAITYGTGLANQTYGSWQDRLAGFVNPELAATQGAASMGGQIAGLYGNDSAARLGLLGASTAGMAGVNQQQAGNDVALGNSLGGLYTGDATNRTGVLGNVTSGNVAASNQQAQGEIRGANNITNAAMGLASLAAGGMGGGSFGALGGMMGGASVGAGGMNLANMGFNPVGLRGSYA